MTMHVRCDTRERNENGMTPAVTGALASEVEFGTDELHRWMTAERCLGGRTSTACGTDVAVRGHVAQAAGGDGPSSWRQAPAYDRRDGQSRRNAGRSAGCHQ